MGKTSKCKDKAKAKTAKADRKIARKCKGAAIIAAFGIAMLVTGCATTDSAQPAKANTMNNTFDDCIIVVATHASVSNRIVTAEGTKDIPAVELFTQTQSLESSGTESFAQTATQTPTTDVKPDITANYAQGGGITNRGTGGAVGTGGAAGIIEKLLGSLTDEGLAALKSAIANKTNGTVTLAKKDGSTVTAECKDGLCTFSDGTVVTAEDCANCTAK